MTVWLGAPAAAAPRPMPLCASADRRRHQRKRDVGGAKKINQQLNPSADQVSDRLTITVEDMGSAAREALRRIARTGTELADECRATIRVSRESGIAVALSRRRPAEYAGFAAALLLVIGLIARVISSRRFFRWPWEKERIVVRRDRSLGGREVVVGNSARRNSLTSSLKFARMNPLVSSDNEFSSRSNSSSSSRVRNRSSDRVPEWWCRSSSSGSAAVEEYEQTRVNALVRVIVDKRLSGKDFVEDDIVELRQMCRSSGAKADFGTENTRDSFFRAAVAFLLSACARSYVDYGGESMVSFICGLAANINLDASKAGSIVNAAVAARTRSGFLQAWANVAQGKHVEGDDEIRQIVSMHNVFPPEENSPHMEMVGRGLESHLSLAERGELFKMYTRIASDGNSYVALEALALPSSFVV